jgi:hypothetical protein
MQLGEALTLWPLVAAVGAFTLVLKPPLIAWITRALGESPRNALRVGLTLGQTSEFSFILGSLALSRSLVDEALIAVVGAVGLLTMGVSSLSIASGDRVVDALDGRGLVPLLTGSRGGAGDPDPTERGGLRDHVIILGMNSLGRRLVELLTERGERVLAIDTDLAKLSGLPCATLLGNAEYFSVLEEAGFRDAKLVISALHIEDVNRLLAYRAQRFGIPAVIHTLDQAAELDMNGLGVAHFMNSREAGVVRIIEELRRQRVILA